MVLTTKSLCRVTLLRKEEEQGTVPIECWVEPREVEEYDKPTACEIKIKAIHSL